MKPYKDIKSLLDISNESLLDIYTKNQEKIQKKYISYSYSNPGNRTCAPPVEKLHTSEKSRMDQRLPGLKGRQGFCSDQTCQSNKGLMPRVYGNFTSWWFHH